MAWRVSYDDSNRCVVYVFIGKNTGSDFHNATSCGIATGKEYQTDHYLVDLQEVDVRASLVDILDMPKKQYEDEQLQRCSRIAVILPKSEKSRAEARFYETASINRGWRVKCFETRSAALNWLKENQASDNQLTL